MKNLLLILILSLSLNGFAQLNLPVKYRVEKQSMSTPMSPIEDIFFLGSYYTKPINIDFDGNILLMKYDNGGVFTEKNVTEINRELESDDDENIILETIYYTDNSNLTDTILFVADYEVGYLQLVLPIRNSQGEKIGYTSYKQYVEIHEVALK